MKVFIKVLRKINYLEVRIRRLSFCGGPVQYVAPTITVTLSLRYRGAGNFHSQEYSLGQGARETLT